MSRHRHPASGFNERLVDVLTAAAVGDEDRWRTDLATIIRSVPATRLDETLWLITWAAADMCADLIADTAHNVDSGHQLELQVPGPTAEIAADIAANVHALLQAARCTDCDGGLLLWRRLTGVDTRTWTMLATLSALTACFALAHTEETS